MVSINLLPWREELREVRRRQFIMVLALTCIISGLCVLAMHGLAVGLIQKQQASNRYLQSEIAKLDVMLKEIDGLQREKERLLARMQIIQQLQANRPQIVKLFDGLVHAVPDGVYVTRLTRKEQKVNIDGRADSNTRVSKFMRQIEASSWLTSPSLSIIQADSKEDGSANGFTLHAMQVAPKVDLIKR